MTAISEGSLIKDRYQILSLLGKGGMATVHLALDLKLQTKVALKILNPDQSRVAKRKERFLKEYSILSKLQHPSIVKVFELEEIDSGSYFFTMEHLEGETLADRIKNAFASNLGVSPEFTSESLNMLKNIAHALQYIHSLGFIYCDLKPSNIIIPKVDAETKNIQSKIKLIDFGIAIEASNQSTEDGPNMIGTSYYMSPEQIRSETLSVRSDVYSFGAVAFELLTGNVPFASEALFTVTASHLIGKIPLAHSINRSVPNVIDRMIQICMQKDLNERYESMQEIVDRLEAVTSKSKDGSVFSRLTRVIFDTILGSSYSK